MTKEQSYIYLLIQSINNKKSTNDLVGDIIKHYEIINPVLASKLLALSYKNLNIKKKDINNKYYLVLKDNDYDFVDTKPTKLFFLKPPIEPDKVILEQEFDLNKVKKDYNYWILTHKTLKEIEPEALDNINYVSLFGENTTLKPLQRLKKTKKYYKILSNI
ncbi:hypothetical protein GE118_00465 [Mycoplasma sp. NEAQ87857]|uniref:hypothetical protein n=1 Tax=Mycoplasma sp. NEAQ87857 TaxID=2683967 RepID=UPI001315CA1C|nr:hypothetical protein [Mycoplasma sp. NEAQ87857]QGZ97277.1 hypothetical protein GE118_00465 [Mycoplasma sp. NEAQ87857]